MTPTPTADNAGGGGMKLSREQCEILDHTLHRAAGGYYCGDSTDMKALVDQGMMESAGRKSFVPSEYFRITIKGKDALYAHKLTVGN